MSDMEREGSREEHLVKHQHSGSDISRSVQLPMWDSSDPARAPPPLPLNPGRSSPVSKPSASPNIAAAAEALAAKSRESNYVTNPLPPRSPEKGFEKSLIRGPLHRRMNSFQPENIRPSPLSPSRDRKTNFDFRTPETSPTRGGVDTALKDFTNSFPELRPSRPASRAITGEPSPQSAAMRALQAPPVEKKDETDSASSTPTSSNLSALIRQPQSFEGIATQILSLTSICTSLQREMAQLSRRSKDNATDLSGLRDATHARDEDIRQTLKELVNNFTAKKEELRGLRETAQDLRQRSASPQADYLDKPSPTASKSFSLPRISSSFPASLVGSQTPNPYTIEGAASIALLEKIHREMATKEGQEKLHTTLADLPASSSEPALASPRYAPAPADSTTPVIDPDVTKKLEEIISLLKDGSANRDNVGQKLDEIVGLVKDNAQSRALVKVEQPREVPSDITGSSPMSMMRAAQNRLADMNRAASFDETKAGAKVGGANIIVNDEVMKLLKRLKDSVSESGGLTAETKALVRELRGEVLGMGREIAKKLEQKEASKAIEDVETPAPGPDREEITEIVQEGLVELKQHFDRIMQEHRRQSNASVTSRSVVDYQEIFNVVSNALKELPAPQQAVIQERDSEAERQAIMDAVKDAWENYKPDLSIDMDGLQRDEILDCLREGLEQHRSKDETAALGGATYEEVMDAVRQGLASFKPPPPPETEASITKDEIMIAVRECLETFEFPIAGEEQARGLDFSRDEILATVKEGLENHEPKDTTLSIEADDLVAAVKLGLQDLPMGDLNNEVLDRTQGLIDEMKAEFQQYSAASGRDTEQVLDALKDGMESLRANIESYFDRAQDVTGKDEIIDTMREGLDQLRVELGGSLETIRQSAGGASNTSEILDSMEKEFEHLRSTLSSTLLRSEETAPGGREELLDAIREGFDEMKANMPTAATSTSEHLSSKVNEELEQIRASLAGAVTRAGSDLTREEIFDAVRDAVEQARVPSGGARDGAESYLSNTSELMDAFNDGLDTLKADIEKLANKPESSDLSHEILQELKEGLASVRQDIDNLHQTTKERRDSESVAREGAIIVADPNAPKALERNDIENLEIMINQLKSKVDTLETMSHAAPAPAPAPAAATAEPDPAVREDIAKVNDLVLELQESIAALSSKEIPVAANGATKEDTEAIETLLRNTKAQLEELSMPEGAATAEALGALEELMKGTRDLVDDLVARHESEVATKDDIASVEVLAKELQTSLEDIKASTAGEKVVKDDLNGLEVICAELKEKMEGLSTEGDALSTKTDIEALSLIVKEFQEKLETEVADLALALGARKTEHGEMTDKVEEVRAFIEEARDELKAMLESRKEEIEAVSTSLTTLGETFSGADTVKELGDTVTREFERSHENHEAMKLDFEQHRDALISKHDEHKGAVVAELGQKIDEKFGELMTRYEDALLAADEKTSTLEQVSTKQGQAVEAAQALSEELKVSIDSLVPTITASCERMTEDGKAAFGQVETIGAKIDDNFASFAGDNKAEHSETRAELVKATQALEVIQSHADEFNPKILSAIADVLERLSEQSAEAKKSAEEIKTTVDAIPGNITLPALPEAPSTVEREVEPVVEKFDDSEIQAKLDQLMEYATEAGKASAQTSLLEEIKEQVSTTAAGLDAFVKSQQTAAIEAQESKARENEEIAIALEKRIAQKDAVEADIVRLMEEREHLTENVEGLMQKEKDLSSLKARMQADLSSLETALHIRREEMQHMEARAESLERRILEGVLDHSRSLLLNTRPKNSLKEMDLKRVPSAASNATVTKKNTSKPTTANNSTISKGIGMALKKRGTPARSGASTPQGERRILSLSTIGANKAAADKAMVLANPVLASTSAVKNGSGSLKRSHSVKTNFPTRKTSWGGTKPPGLYADAIEEDKENSIYEDEEESDYAGDDRTSLGGQTDRRTSYAGTHTDNMSYVTGSQVTNSEFDGEEGDSRSILTSEGATLEHQHDGDDLSEDDSEAESPTEVLNGHKKRRPWMPSDSGIGSDLPTAAMTVGSTPSEYFGDD